MSQSLHQTDAFQLLSAALHPQGFINITGLKRNAQPVQKSFDPGEYRRAVDEAMRLSDDGFDAYFCTSTLMSDASRKAENVHAVKCLKLDIDIGADNHAKYASKREAIEALIAFCANLRLPVPTTIDSGGGIHAYWIMDAALNAADGKQYSEKFKAICVAHGLKIDPTVTGDIARILRVPQTLNYKQAVARKVKLKGRVDLHDMSDILDQLDALHSAIEHTSSVLPSPGLLAGTPLPAHLRDVQLDAFTRGLVEGRPKSFAVLIDRCNARTGCNQIKNIYDNQAEQDEPRWRAGLSVAFFCADGAEAIHDLSRQHSDYDHNKTVQKVQGLVGPFKCSTFESNWPTHCNGCPHKGKITSPIQLGEIDDATASVPMDEAMAAIRDAEERAKAGDCGAPFEPNVIAALQALRKNDAAEYRRMRSALKKANRDVSIASLDALMTGQAESKERSAADALVSLARAQCTFFHDPDGDPHATFQHKEHRECWHLNSKGFSEWLSYQFYKSFGTAPTEPSMATALSTLSGQAKFEGEERPVAVRVAKLGADYYVDLCNDLWQAVRVTASGWQVIDAPPIMFMRNSAMRPLPTPVTGGCVDDLWQFANIAAEDRELVLAWMIEAYRPDTPYPALELCGEQGSAKSSTQSVLRGLIDPNKANLRAKPKVLDDLFVSARVSHVTSLENLSFLQPDWQDALCALATGAGYGGRQLYTNADECVHEVKRPIIMNGISVVATRQDLMDRVLLVNLPTIAHHRSEADIQDAFDHAKAGIFGALLDLFSQALAILPCVQIVPEDQPRMADFANLGEAVFRALGRADGEFLTKYREKRRHGIEQTIESNPVAVAITALLDKTPAGFSGALKQLHRSLGVYRPDGEHWPRSAHALGDSLRRISPALRTIGIEVECLGRRRDGYHWQIKGDIYPPA